MEIKINSRFNLGTKVFFKAEGEVERRCEECGQYHTTTGTKIMEGTIDAIDFSYLHTNGDKPYQRVIYIVKTSEGRFPKKGENVFSTKEKAKASL